MPWQKIANVTGAASLILSSGQVGILDLNPQPKLSYSCDQQSFMIFGGINNDKEDCRETAIITFERTYAQYDFTNVE